ncbi:MAG: hypothetical protein KatS3mg024_1794 [Armatimonadota bacterium]|nr:MAG: hypothetical protein KatS3mg024_1794 [Armatimonadota bacterium]
MDTARSRLRPARSERAPHTGANANCANAYTEDSEMMAYGLAVNRCAQTGRSGMTSANANTSRKTTANTAPSALRDALEVVSPE